MLKLYLFINNCLEPDKTEKQKTISKQQNSLCSCDKFCIQTVESYTEMAYIYQILNQVDFFKEKKIKIKNINFGSLTQLLTLNIHLLDASYFREVKTYFEKISYLIINYF